MRFSVSESGEGDVVSAVGVVGDGLAVSDDGDPAIHSLKGKFKSVVPSASQDDLLYCPQL
jgi:hypothetical protein